MKAFKFPPPLCSPLLPPEEASESFSHTHTERKKTGLCMRLKKIRRDSQSNFPSFRCPINSSFSLLLSTIFHIPNLRLSCKSSRSPLQIFARENPLFPEYFLQPFLPPFPFLILRQISLLFVRTNSFPQLCFACFSMGSTGSSSVWSASLSTHLPLFSRFDFQAGATKI